jgi:hypothetical protein
MTMRQEENSSGLGTGAASVSSMEDSCLETCDELASVFIVMATPDDTVTGISSWGTTATDSSELPVLWTKLKLERSE